MNDIATTEDKIAARIDSGVADKLQVSKTAGGLSFGNMLQVMEFAKMMAISQVAIPKHLRGNPGACLGVVMQAVEWEMSPYSVANKSYSVNDRLAYEAQLINAVILRRAPITGRFVVSFDGDGEKRRCTVKVTLKDGTAVDYTSPETGRIPVKNSPLWKGDPDQQLFYYSSRALCRRHFPDVLMGVYGQDELEDAEENLSAETAKDITPRLTLGQKMQALAGHEETTTEESAPQLDERTEALLSAGTLAAEGGEKVFKMWWDRLSASDAEAMKPHLEGLRGTVAI